MPLVKVKEKFQVTIPATVRKTRRLAVGDLLEAETKNNTIVLKPKAAVDRASKNDEIPSCGKSVAGLPCPSLLPPSTR